MKAAVDVSYREGSAVAACVAFDGWQDGEPTSRVREVLPAAARYRAGRFFERELPCLMAVLGKAATRFEVILIDGYVHLRVDHGTGLGARLVEALPYPAVIIGVAKNPLAIADRFVPVTRGRSRKPLFVSAIGCPVDLQVALIESGALGRQAEAQPRQRLPGQLGPVLEEVALRVLAMRVVI